MSATVCRPVISSRSSFGPSVMFTLQDSPSHSGDTVSRQAGSALPGGHLHMIEEECASMAALE
jgi:hypothetical protein